MTQEAKGPSALPPKPVRAQEPSPAPEKKVGVGKGAHRSWPVIVESMAAGVAVVLVLLWLAGAFRAKVDSASVAPPVRPVPEQGAVVEAKTYSLPRYEWAIGNIQAVHETTLGSKILAKVVETAVKAGQTVKENQVLLRLDDADLKARVSQSEAAVSAAEAQLAQAKTEYDRVMDLAKQHAAAEQEINTSTSQYKAAQARLDQARSALQESKEVLSYAVIRSPFDGLVIDKKVEAGDTVTPGQTLVKLYDPKRMQLVATVRESLASDLKAGQSLQAYIPAMKKLCHGTIAEIVPQAQAASRSFQVKVVGPCAPGVYTGMFGRLLIPLGEENVLLIPWAAVRSVGQLTLVDAVVDNHLERRSIQVGRRFENFVEVLSGLSSGEKVYTPVKITMPDKPAFAPTYLWDNLPVTETCPATQPN